MTNEELKGRLKHIMELQKKASWYKIGQCVLGALTALAVVALMFILFLMEG